MHPRLGQGLVLATLVCALAAGAFAQVDSNARIVRISFVQGDVRMDRPGAEGLNTAFLNMPVIAGSRIVTGSDGYAELEFEAGGTVRLTPNSELNVRELGLRGDNKVSLLDFMSGIAYFNVKQDSDDDFRVTLSGQELRVPKSSRFRIRLQRDSAEIAVTKGELQLAGGEHDVRIKKNETLLLDFQDRGRYFLAKNVAPLSFDTWDQERGAYRDRYVATSNSYRGYSNSYSYGVSDLNYYGSYMNMPGYGYVWRPYGYDISWDPFMDGAWVWYPGYGYTWVSGYSWGWMPYRYGRWVYVSGYGWMWQPGNQWRRWHTRSTVYNPPHNYRRPTPPIYPPASGGGPGGGGGRVVVVGKGAYHGSGVSDPRFRKDGGDNAHVRGSGIPPNNSSTNNGSATNGSANNGGVTPGVRADLPSVLAPGVDSNSNVRQELRRVHGDDLGPVRARGRSEDNAVTSAATVTSTGNASTTSNAGGSTTTMGNTSGATTTTTTTVTTTVATPAPVQPPVVNAPPIRSDNGGRPAAPAESAPASTRSTSGYTPRSTGSGSGASSRPASTYYPPSSSSGGSSSGSSRSSSSLTSQPSRSTSSSSSGRQSSSPPPQRRNNPK
ncbi:MAG: FecR domain-containing protein [Candidatus Koribacter versatilis]|uniref:FecR domain-containing protein n=1 Tax=Candidatus Korobacter versatilis TaxID=658062 RepID=A0A932A6I7_9BACT|nr:FecR domain-containing protein [Candidatus Koribacter versatilis]